MSVKEREMAELLAKAHREEMLSTVTAYVNPDVSAILDLGCGIGALTTRLAERFPSTLIIGLDRSKYLLSKLQKKQNILKVLADIPNLPIKNGFFESVLTVQVLHEVFHFKGIHALIKTFKKVFELLKKNGKLIILDHFNPGDVSISFRLSEELRRKLREFQLKFKPREIGYHDLGKGWVRSSMRDFYDFITKIWALNSGLEEEEMSETHTPFTRQELVDFVQETGFKIVHVASITSIDRHLEYYGITVEPNLKLPDRHLMLIAKKS